jgi:hypothetical protein
MDDVSISVLKAELQLLLNGLEDHLPHAISFRDWVARYSANLSGGAFEPEMDYWSEVQNSIKGPVELAQAAAKPGGIAVLRTTVGREAIDTSARRSRSPHDLLLTSSAIMVSRLLSLAIVPCRMVAAGRNCFPGLNDSFTVGWLAYHYPLSINVASDAIGTYLNVVRAIRTVPNRGVGFGWLRHVARRTPLMAGPRLSELPMYFNFLPRWPLSKDNFIERNDRLPASAEARTSMIGVGINVEERDNEFVIAATFDTGMLSELSVAKGLSQLNGTLSELRAALD